MASTAVATDRRTRLDWHLVVVVAATAAFIVTFSVRMVQQYQRFGLNAFDLGIFDQGLWLLSRFQDPFVTVRGVHLFGDHTSYLMIPLAPLYWIAPHAEALLVFTVVLLAAGAPLAYLAARAIGAPGLLSAVVAVGYLAAPATQWNVRDTFHPELFVVPLLIGSFLLFARDRDGWGLALALIALLAKEDAALIVVPFGLLVWWWFGKRRDGLIIAGTGVAFLLVAFQVLLPSLSPTGEMLYQWRYARLGSGFLGIATGLVIHPEVLGEALLDPQRWQYLALVVLPVPLALAAPRALLVAVPAALANLVSTHPYQYEIEYHYSTYLLIGVVLAAVIGARHVGEWDGKAWRYGAVALSLVAALVFVSWSPLSTPWSQPHLNQDAAREAIALIPPDATVSAWNRYLPHLTHRTTIYEFPNPWERLNYSAPGLPLPSPADVDWVLARDGEFQEVTDELVGSGDWEVVYDQDPVLLLHRR
jgi:uncharacterized membrane protein